MRVRVPQDEFKFESFQDCSSICEYLKSLQDGFAKKRLVLRSQKQEIVMNPRGLLKFEIKAKKKEDHVRLKLEISWKNGKNVDETGKFLIIQSMK